MAVPRPLLLAVLGLLLVSATFMATRNANPASNPSKQVAQAPAPKPAAKPHTQASKPHTQASKPHTQAAKPHPAPAKPHAKPAPRESRSSGHRARPERVARHTNVDTPAAATRAIEQGRVVVLGFFQRHGADDAGSKAAVASVRSRHLASVFVDDIDNIGRYERIVGSLGIHQAPAIVIVDSKRHARLVEGYVDPESLAQEVSDARK